MRMLRPGATSGARGRDPNGLSEPWPPPVNLFPGLPAPSRRVPGQRRPHRTHFGHVVFWMRRGLLPAAGWCPAGRSRHSTKERRESPRSVAHGGEVDSPKEPRAPAEGGMRGGEGPQRHHPTKREAKPGAERNGSRKRRPRGQPHPTGRKRARGPHVVRCKGRGRGDNGGEGPPATVGRCPPRRIQLGQKRHKARDLQAGCPRMSTAATVTYPRMAEGPRIHAASRGRIPRRESTSAATMAHHGIAPHPRDKTHGGQRQGQEPLPAERTGERGKHG